MHCAVPRQLHPALGGQEKQEKQKINKLAKFLHKKKEKKLI